MLITRPFTNEEVADRLEVMRGDLSIAPTTPEHSGLIAEACRRLRGQLPSGADKQNDLIVKLGDALLPLFLAAPSYSEKGGKAVDAYDEWCRQFAADLQAARARAAASIGRPEERVETE